MEEWRKVPGFPAYSVSNYGRVTRTSPSPRYAVTGKMLGSKSASTGYRFVSLYLDGEQFAQGVHVVVCTAFHGPRPSPDHQATHKDGSRDNNHADNLRWATRQENMADKYIHGTMPLGDNHHSRLRPDRMARGERNGGGGKLTESDVRKIRKDGRLHYVIAKDYGVVKSMVSMIKRGEVWRHVT